jgi:hypothetical protein
LFSVVIFFLYTQKAGAEEQKALANKQIEATTANYNNALSLYSRVTGIKNIKKNAINWTKVLNEIGSQTPMNVEIGTISFSTTATGRTRISGFGASDKDIVLFKENLAKSDFFQFVDLDSIGEGSDSKSRSVKSFTISLTLNLGKAK